MLFDYTFNRHVLFIALTLLTPHTLSIFDIMVKWYWWGIPLFAAGMYFVFGRVDKHMTQAEAKVGVPPTSQGHLHTPPAPSIHHVTAPTAHPLLPPGTPMYAAYAHSGGCSSCGMGSVKSWEDLDEDVSEFDVQPWADSYGDVGDITLY